MIYHIPYFVEEYYVATIEASSLQEALDKFDTLPSDAYTSEFRNRIDDYEVDLCGLENENEGLTEEDFRFLYQDNQ